MLSSSSFEVPVGQTPLGFEEWTRRNQQTQGPAPQNRFLPTWCNTEPRLSICCGSVAMNLREGCGWQENGDGQSVKMPRILKAAL